jgi:Ca2+-binding EF-hand superfamily protein
MKPTTLLAISLAFATLFLGGCASSERASSPGLFEKYDTNKDGSISHEEFSREAKTQAFQSMDPNGDGIVTWDEWQKADPSPRALEHFQAVDLDKDGKITLLEFLSSPGVNTAADDTFVAIDRNRDNSITQHEFTGFKGLPILTIHF